MEAKAVPVAMPEKKTRDSVLAQQAKDFIASERRLQIVSESRQCRVMRDDEDVLFFLSAL